MTTDEFRRGDLVEVRPAAEILRTLDGRGELDSMPFMPEMVEYCGRRFTVDRRTEKVCDTINNTLQSRRLANTVLLDDLRCTGAAHGGCQAECRYYWNEAWLRPVEPGDPATSCGSDQADVAALLERVMSNARPLGESGAYRCQATQMAAASTPLSNTDPRPYFRELTSKNVTIRTFARVMPKVAVMQPMHKLGLLRRPLGTSNRSPKGETLDLQPGEWVHVKSREEIVATLTEAGSNRGLHFDIEMVPFCGKVVQVRSRVNRLLDERTGEMIELTSDCIKLEHVVCEAELSTGRWFCPREIYPYWRECWLERVEAPVAAERAPGC